jgi:hypothetical protein
MVGSDLTASWPAGPRSWVVANRHKRSRRWLMLLVVAVVLAAAMVIVLLAKAAGYQPLTYGSTGDSVLAYPGLPAAQGARTVNTFGSLRQDVYIPPQREGYAFYLFEDIANSGSRAVTIESVGLPRYSALTPAGPARYAPPGEDPHVRIPPARDVLHEVTLEPGGELLVAIPVRSGPCWMRDGFQTLPSFDVTYRFLFFTRTVALPWNSQNGEVILRAHGRAGQPGVMCRASR